jgi:hypothetical protein
MKWFNIIRFGNCAEGSLSVGEGELTNTEPWALMAHTPIDAWSIPTLRGIDPKENGPPDDTVVNHLGLPIFSPRLQRTLKNEADAKIQYLPVRIVRWSGELLEDFAIANVLDARCALDRSRARFSVFPNDYFLQDRRGKISGIQRIVLIGEALSGAELIRLEEYSATLLCSERIKRIFDDNHFTGWGFEPVEVIYTTH